MLQLFRALMHAHCVCHITRVINNEGAVPGWRCVSDTALAERDDSDVHGSLRGTNDYGDDLFELRDGNVIVKPLKRMLEFVPPAMVRSCRGVCSCVDLGRRLHRS